ncbi:MAG: GntR family transcriptional regulator [Rhizobiales bacterium]|nr:GntR family transcriptional regulator [Hyphomicrobiales bacterium]
MSAEPARSGASPLYELIYSTLREQLVEGSLMPGLVLGEATVARAFQASRVPAAAALRRLHREGLIRDFEGRGFIATGDRASEPRRVELVEAGLRLPAMVAGKLQRRNQRDRIYPAVEHVIAAVLPYGRFQINESAIAEYHGVSRTVAHEVLTRLERTGLAIQDKNQRWYAGPLTPPLLHDHFEMRCLLEPVALVQVAASIDRAELETKLERARATRDGRRTLEKIERLERDLHGEIVLRCRNEQLRESIRRSQLVLIAIHHAFDLYRDAASIGLMIDEHIAILDQLLRGKAAAAARALESHLRRSLVQNTRLLENLGPLSDSRLFPYLTPIDG